MAMIGLAFVSLATAIVLLLVVRHTSDQPRLAAVKRQIRAGLLEIRLFNDDLRAILRAQAEILRHNLVYLRLSLVPLLWVLVPLLLLTVQLHALYGYDGLRPGEAALVKVRVEERAGASPVLALAASGGVRVETPPVWIPGQREAAWRIRATEPGRHEMEVSVNGEPFTKRVVVGAGFERRAPLRAGPGLLNRILHPAEPPLPAGAPVSSIEVTYPTRSIPVLGWHLHWMVPFFGLTLLFALILRRPLRVTL